MKTFLRQFILPLKEIDEILPKTGLIVDLGCGEGTIAQYLAETKTRKVVGVDLNENRLKKPKQKSLTFRYGDSRKFNMRGVEGVVLSDMLHHMNFKDQEKTLSGVFKSLKKGGVLVIKEIDTAEWVRSSLSRLWDRLLYPKERIYFSNSDNLITTLERIGYKVKFSRSSRHFPGSTNLFICKKP
jgi:ubiquinone/menaquinone biosynthesis C-methylase UbiE